MIYNEIAIANGNIFMHAFDILYKRMNQGTFQLLQEQNNQNTLDASLIIPTCINGNFACEIFLKSLLPANLKDIRGKKGHNLNHLFNHNAMDKNTSNSIKQKTVQKMKVHNSMYTNGDFDSDLQNNCLNFVEWRYFHEKTPKNSAGILFINNFLKSISETIQEERLKTNT